MQHRIIYFFAVLATISCGLFVRLKRAWFPEYINFWLGDTLYAFMMYFAVAMIFASWTIRARAVTALIVCYCIELSQLYQPDWLNAIRETLPGRLVLGSGFLWSDLAAYLAGVAAAYIIDTVWLCHYKSAGKN